MNIDSKYGSNNGFDVGTKQMSDKWIKGGTRLTDAVGNDLAKNILPGGIAGTASGFNFYSHVNQ